MHRGGRRDASKRPRVKFPPPSRGRTQPHRGALVVVIRDSAGGVLTCVCMYTMPSEGRGRQRVAVAAMRAARCDAASLRAVGLTHCGHPSPTRPPPMEQPAHGL
ncbi:hypothetical protein HPB50_007975 [Hyalomma asiaticum]|uniref:Uncharacterized protein n=1 Tax=Hyalomma asiaticum TaxID=266040 RepID=A0ACB7T8T1_HYAAI|nr:hypothetical protein HPB50_007975 [Hyalomma asiaticum]